MPLAAQASTLKMVNMRRFIEEIRRRGPSTRAELGRATGVAAPTSSTIIADLVECGLIEEAEMRSAGKGRPGRVYRLATEDVYVIGATLSPEEFRIAPALLDGSVLTEGLRCVATPADYSRVSKMISAHVAEIHAERPGVCLGFALSVPGLIDERAGRVALSPNLHVIDGQPLGADLAATLKIDVLCVQEEHALCLAEQTSGLGQGLSDFVVLDVTYGMGMGVVSAGRYVSGRDGFAGEIGHMTAEPEGKPCGCGNRGCFETVATDLAFLQAVRERLGAEVGFPEVQFMVREGLVDVRPELDQTLAFLAIAVAGIVNIFNPEAVLISSRLFDLGPGVLSRLVELAGERSLAPCRHAQILPSKANRLEGVLAGLLNHVFARVGPILA